MILTRICFAILLLVVYSRPLGAQFDEPADLVQPLVDAANSRWFYFNSATRPFGMVNLSPDMGIEGAWNSGYRYNQDTIRAFSHIHAWQLSGIPVLPTTGSFRGHLGPSKYGSAYSHEREMVKAGYHQIYLDSYDVDVELTATNRVGFHRYTFPIDQLCHIQVDLATFLGPCDQKSGMVRKVNDQELEGYALMGATRRRPKDTYVYFVISLDKPFEKFGTWRDGALVQDETEHIEGERVGAYVSFQSSGEVETRLMKVAISYVSVEQARLNMEQELSHWDFDGTVADARNDWNKWLSRIKVEGGTLEQQQRFYTDLWHALQGRRIISDVNGKYCDMTGERREIRQIPLDESGKPKFDHYNSDSYWGAQWTLNTLWHLVYPEVSEAFVNSMIMMYEDGGLIPRGPSGGNYTYVMTGSSSTPFIVSAYQKGLRNFDIDKAYEGLVSNHLPGGMMAHAGYEHNSALGGGLDYYMQDGYVPYPLPDGGHGFHESGGGQTMEYAYQDWCLAQMAKALGKDEDYTTFMNRSQNYRNLWNADLGWMWIREQGGKWRSPEDVLDGKGWVEGNAAQFTWFVPHDLDGLANLMGGRKSMSQKLDFAFSEAIKHDFTASKSHDQETARQNARRYINYGNQPSIQTAFIFNYAGTPWLTQKWSRKVVDGVYSGISPQLGYNGDEDQGLMGSLAVLMKVGLFSMRGGAAVQPVYDIGSPIFDKITIDLNSDYYEGGKLEIETVSNSKENMYIQSATFQDTPLDQCWIYHEDLVKGGKLTLRMGPEPNQQWASDPDSLPPSSFTDK